MTERAGQLDADERNGGLFLVARWDGQIGHAPQLVDVPRAGGFHDAVTKNRV